MTGRDVIVWYDLSEVPCPFNLSRAILNVLNDKPRATTTSKHAETIAKSAEVAASKSLKREPITLVQAADHMGKVQ
jgi:hypothetical protein